MTGSASPGVQDILRAASADPVYKCREVFNFWPWSKQREILWSVRNNAKTAVPSCHGVGKTAIAARAVLDFATEPGPFRVVTTAPIWDQVKDLLWAEIHVACRDARIPIGGKLDLTRLTFDADRFAIGFSTDEPERFAGHHSERLLFVVDEASGVKEPIYNAGKGFQTAKNARVLLIGNPTKPAGTFFRACRAGSGYNVIQMSAYDSPNLTGERVPAKLRDALTTKQWVDEMLADCGGDVNHPEFRIRVLGLFAATLGRAFFNADDLNAAEAACVDPLYVGRLQGDPTRGNKGTLRFKENARDSHTTLYELPHPDHHYVIFGDVAGAGISVEEQEVRPVGKKDDFNAAVVVDLDTGDIACVLHGQMDEEEYALDLARLGWFYREAEIAVEATGGYGQLTIGTLLRRYRYRKLFARQKVDSNTGRKGHVYGWDTNSTSRPSMLNALRSVVKNQPSAIRSRDIIDEQRTFVWLDNGKRAEAQAGCHDDLVMAAAGAFLLRELRTTATIEVPHAKKKQPLSGRAVEQIRVPGSTAATEALPTMRPRRRLTVAQRAHQDAAKTMSHPGATRR